jgi:hypothetical protein
MCDDCRDGLDYEPDPTDYLEQLAQEQHEDQVHDGKPCNCPRPPSLPEPPGGYDDEPPF